MEGGKIRETGWRSAFPVLQGQGIATKATLLVIEQARATGKHQFIHAHPSVDNATSNAIRRKAGFMLQGDGEFKYPPWHFMRCNDWRLDLFKDN